MIKAATKDRLTNKRARRGAALVVVLLMLAVISILLAEFLYEQRIQTTLLKNHEAKVRARYIARAGQNAADGLIAHIAPDDPRFNNEMIQLFRYNCLSPPAFSSLGFTSEQEEDTQEQLTDLAELEGCGAWSLSIPYVLDETPLDLEISDEQARLNINALMIRMNVTPKGQTQMEYEYRLSDAFARVLFELFQYQAVKHQIEISELDLRVMIESHLADYIDFGIVHGTFDKDDYSYFEYKKEDRIIPMKNAPLDTVDEIRYLPGMTDELFNAVKDFLTVYPTDLAGNYQGGVNLHAAPVEVIYAVIRGASYQNDEPTIEAEEAMQFANEIVMTAYQGGEGAAQQEGVPALPKTRRTLPAELAKNAAINKMLILDPKKQIPRFFRVRSTALTDDGLETTITRVVKDRGRGQMTSLYYRVE